ncbi:hypothetical protein SAMN05444266_10624 [Chitinophaga jiangningensis]|uniref:Uncharacterized protein n=1 Tax=Chitinophaga jiangningensis TaxID=1419482 RepID=A0A1M7F7M4_9BACT|nr:hypothetical protein SAMN05444266_10624 [Chitinophaga jiangningensis]
MRKLGNLKAIRNSGYYLIRPDSVRKTNVQIIRNSAKIEL